MTQSIVSARSSAGRHRPIRSGFAWLLCACVAWLAIGAARADAVLDPSLLPAIKSATFEVVDLEPDLDVGLIRIHPGRRLPASPVVGASVPSAPRPRWIR